MTTSKSKGRFKKKRIDSHNESIRIANWNALPVANDICRSAVPALKYLPERRFTAFPHHYTPGYANLRAQKAQARYRCTLHSNRATPQNAIA